MLSFFVCGSEDSVVETDESPAEHPGGTNGKSAKDEATNEPSSALRMFSCMGSDVFEESDDSPETYEQAMQRCRKQVQTKLDESSSPELPDDVEPSSLEWWSGETRENNEESAADEEAKNVAAAHKELFDFEERNSVEEHPLSSPSPTIELLRDDETLRRQEEQEGD